MRASLKGGVFRLKGGVRNPKKPEPGTMPERLKPGEKAGLKIKRAEELASFEPGCRAALTHRSRR
jgi:hypothetical protein